MPGKDDLHEMLGCSSIIIALAVAVVLMRLAPALVSLLNRIAQ